MPNLVFGVAGCGSMGLPMARRLVGAGFETWGFDVRPVSEFGDFAPRMVADPADFQSRVDVVISVVRDWRQTQDLLFDQQALFADQPRPRILVVASTLSPRVLGQITERLPQGIAVVDAPMSGAPYSAEAGRLTFMVGGPDAVVETLMPAFKAMGETVHHLGDTGAGLACKVANNFVAASTVVVVRKALEAAQQLGVDPRRLLAVMQTSSGGTWYGNNLDRISWSREGYEPGNTMGILEKDVGAFVDALGEEADPLTRAVLDGLRATKPLKGV